MKSGQPSTVITELFMLKLLIIGIKDLKIIFRDRAALIMMLLAPFLLTLGMGLVTGRFSGSSNTGISDIPVIIVNLDKEQLGNALEDVFTGEELAGLVQATLSERPEAARKAIDDDTAAAAIIVPAGFTRSIIPQQGAFDEEPEPLQIELYANPARPTSAGIVKSIVDEFISRIEEGRISGQTSIFQMIISGRITPQQGEQAGMEMAERLEDEPFDETLAIQLNTDTNEVEAVQFDVLAYLAPGMALMFLMFTVSYGGRSILAEKTQGTLPRLLVSPTVSAQILGGKVFGIFLTGVAQMLILIGATTLLFQLK
ncbi:MAG TPA: ABC transporter permease, partial [Anaerolineales bacterium]|nr:ABC transporter permease [Anaerolineales bacterium]